MELLQALEQTFPSLECIALGGVTACVVPYVTDAHDHRAKRQPVVEGGRLI